MVAFLLATGFLATGFLATGSQRGGASASTVTDSAQGWAPDLGLAKRLTRAVAADLDRVLVRARGQLVVLSRLPAVRAHNAPACNREMAARLSPRYTALGAVDRAGNLYCDAPPVTSPASVADRAYFLRAIGTDGFAVGDFQIGSQTHNKGLGMGYPTRGADGAINGVVLSPLSLSWLNQHVEGVRPRAAVDVLVVDDHGTVLARAGRIQTPPGQNLGANPLVRAMLAHPQGVGRFRLGQLHVSSAFRTVRASDGEVHVAVSVS